MYVRDWKFTVSIYGFKTIMFVNGTEVEVQDYMQSEFGYIPSYVGASEEDVARFKKLGGKVYLAPKKEVAR